MKKTNTRRFSTLFLIIVLFLNILAVNIQAQTRIAKTGRLVLVELFTSQGCDMCPTAEKILVELGSANKSIVPVSLHVDYFNKPWKDPFSDQLYSERQMSYHKTYKGVKDPDLGLYYTPMIMVDGITTVNGRNSAGLKSAVASARQKKPGVSIQATLNHENKAGKLKLEVSIKPLTTTLNAKEQLVCAVLRLRKSTTMVNSGENAGKTLENYYPSLKFLFEKMKFENNATHVTNFEFTTDKSYNISDLDFIIFVQDITTGEVHQTAVIPVAGTS